MCRLWETIAAVAMDDQTLNRAHLGEVCTLYRRTLNTYTDPWPCTHWHLAVWVRIQSIAAGVHARRHHREAHARGADGDGR